MTLKLVPSHEKALQALEATVCSDATAVIDSRAYARTTTLLTPALFSLLRTLSSQVAQFTNAELATLAVRALPQGSETVEVSTL
jgi:predicted transcriptional regulator